MKKYSMELVVGVFVSVGIVAMVYLSVNLGDVSLFGDKGYIVFAEFDGPRERRVYVKVMEG